MNKIIVAFIAVACIGLIGGYLYMNSIEKPKAVAENNIQKNNSPKNATYNIEGTSVTLVNGTSEVEAAPGSASMVVTKYFGNEVKTDLNNDGREDEVFLLTQSSGGSGTFFYVVAALNTEDGWVGSQSYLLGDRIAPQTTELSQNPNHKNVIVVNYMDRAEGQAMSEQPSVGKSVWLKLDPATMQFGVVEQNFEGEADAGSMTLEMKKWTWVKTNRSNATELVPKKLDAFTLTFKSDGTFSATTDCNSMGGKYETKDSKLTFGQVVTTELFCEGSQEKEFSKMLGEVESYQFTNKGELVLGLKSENGSSIFQ